MRKLFTLLSLAALSLSATVSSAQNRSFSRPVSSRTVTSVENFWRSVPEGQAPSQSLMRIKPAKYKVYSLEGTLLRLQMFSASANPGEAITVKLPLADGSFKDFKVWQTPMLHGRLASRYPGIKTFTAEAVGDPRITARLDWTSFGFHAMIFDGGEVSFVDPYDMYNDGYYLVHYKKDEHREFAHRMKCEVGSPEEEVAGKLPGFMDVKKLPGLTVPKSFSSRPPSALRLGIGTVKRTYEVAISANSFYCQAATGLPSPSIAQCLSAITTTMNRVNGVYNREFGVDMVFCANMDTLIWPTATGSINGADPFFADNSNAGNCLTINQTVVTARIGSANYDVGHVFTTGAGGLASLGIVCFNSSKAQGVTGSGTPVGDGFDIDYVAHEFGHEFGSNHTFNNNQNGSCSGNAASSSAYEPGSGATIMDYAGICSPDNLQANSDAYFSGSSVTQITARLVGSAATCATTTSSGHDTARVPAFTRSYNIPYKTPFELTGPTATLAAGAPDTSLTYQWFQWNLGSTGASGDFGNRFNQAAVRAPIFRSFNPVYTPYRMFPRLSLVLNGSLSDAALSSGTRGEKAADTARYLTFKMAVRNIYNGLGCINIPDDSIHLDVRSTGAANGYAGFTVTSQNTAVTYTGGTTQTITWNVVGTNAAPVSCANVDIFMSTDGGVTWPYTIGTFPNTGSASVSIPNPPASTTTARIKVKGNNNVFFNINGSNFTVNPGAVTAPITGTFTVCAGATTTLASTTPGGTWSSSTPAIATVGLSTGIVTGIAGGTATISYNAPSGTVTAVVTVNTVPSPAAITGTSGVCLGQTVTLANATPGGTWSSTNTAVATVSSSGVVSGISSGTATISYVVTNACGLGGAVRTVTVSAPTAVAAISGTLSTCTGSTTALGNATPSGTWSSSATSVATVSTSGVVTGVAAGTAIISYSVTNPSGCVSSATAVVTINALPSAAITPAGPVAICTGGSATLSASTSAGFTYQWQISGSAITGATNATHVVTAAGSYNVILSNGTCSTTSSAVTITVSASAVVVPSVTVTSGSGLIFCGTAPSITFTATPVNGGSTPAYQWYVNSVASGTGTATFTYTPVNGDTIKAMLTSSEPCASPTTAMASVVVTVNPAAAPSVTVTAIPNDTVCTGDPVTYAAVPSFGGSAPSYLWTENGINIATGPTYTTTHPADGDVIICTMTSNYDCRTSSVATSAPFVMRVLAPVTNVIAITASATDISGGTSVTFAAIAPYASAYQWYLSGTPVPGATSSVYVTDSLNDGEIVTCAAISGNVCALPGVVMSSGITMHVTGIKETILSNFSIMPNPNKGTFVISGHTRSSDPLDISIINLLGQRIYQETLNGHNRNIHHQVTVTETLANGMYLIKVTSGGDHVVFHMVLDR